MRYAVLDCWPRWALMWLLAAAIFACCKALTWFAARPSAAPLRRHLGYLLLWPGLDANAFLSATIVRRPTSNAWLFALLKLGAGVILIWAVAPWLPRELELLRGWVGMIGIVFVLHFGIFDLLGLAWRSSGVNAKPLMDWPIGATSVSDFWGRRWNTAFRDLTHQWIFRPLTARWGPTAALLVVFVCSGIAHDLVISLPAGAGWGGPTAYFLIQGVALLVERSPFGARLGLAGNRMYVLAVVLLPVGLLFHPPFVCEVIVPFLDFITTRHP